MSMPVIHPALTHAGRHGRLLSEFLLSFSRGNPATFTTGLVSGRDGQDRCASYMACWCRSSPSTQNGMLLLESVQSRQLRSMFGWTVRPFIFEPNFRITAVETMFHVSRRMRASLVQDPAAAPPLEMKEQIQEAEPERKKM